MKKYILIVLASILAAVVLQSHYEYQCKVNGAGWATVTVDGVLCGYNLNGMEKNIRLTDLLERVEKMRIFNECVKNNTGAEYKCSPQYIPPPTNDMDA